MAEKDIVFKGKIKQTGIFDFKEFYTFAYVWLDDDNYHTKEKVYNEKVLGDAKDIEINWESEKKVSDYFKFQIKMVWKVYGMKKVEVKKEDTKVNMNSGNLEIAFTATLIKDYEHRWENNPLWKFLRGVYDHYIIRKRIEDYEDKLEDELNELIDQCKAFLALESKR